MVQQSGATVGDAIVLTKPIGTGVLLAAEMHQSADGDDYTAALTSMLRSQAKASQYLATAATAMTDVTGFGLAGHLLNILKASGVSARLSGSAIPVLEGAWALAEAGMRSTLWASNMAISDQVSMPEGPLRDLLFDPQTCGGLLATIPAAQVDDLLRNFEDDNEPIWRVGTIEAGPAHINVID